MYEIWLIFQYLIVVIPLLWIGFRWPGKLICLSAQTVLLCRPDVYGPIVTKLETHAKVRMIESTSDSDFSVFRYQYIVEFRQALIFDRWSHQIINIKEHCRLYFIFCLKMTDGMSKLEYFWQFFAKTSFMTASG